MRLKTHSSNWFAVVQSAWHSSFFLNDQLLGGCQDDHRRLLDASHSAPGTEEEQSASLGDGTAAFA